ncbi:hypothetical protein ScPMuIL_005445 [Solemya velum]
MAGSSFNAGQALLGHFSNVNIPTELQHRFNLQAQSSLAADHRHYIAPVNVPGTSAVNLQTPVPYGHASQDGSVTVNLDFAGIQQDSDSGFASEANFSGLPSQEMHDENQNMENGHAHGHNHNHEHNQSMIRPDWKIFTNSMVFIVILFLRLMSDHIMGLLIFLALAGTFYFTNRKLKHQVHVSSLRGSRYSHVSLHSICMILFLLMNISALYYVFREQELWKVLGFMLPPVWQPNVWMLLWVVVITDFILKFVTIILKLLIMVVPAFCISQKKKGKFYMLIEHSVQLYRLLIPILPWVHFLLDEQTSGKWFFGGFLLIVYSVFKLYMIFVKIKDVKNAVVRLKMDLVYGIKPSSEELHARGENCPICQDDYKEPVMLNCKHIFCENCVSVWFDREKTCPMCRAQICTETPAWRDGSSSCHIQWY